MEFDMFFSLLAVCLGLIGSVFLAKGIVFLSAKNLLRLTSPYTRWAYAPEQINSLAAQKADALTDVLVIFLAFLTQLAALVIAGRDSPLFKTQWAGILMLLAIILPLAIVAYFAGKWYRNRTRLAIGKIAVKEYCVEGFERVIDPSTLKSLETMAKDLLGMGRGIAEGRVDFLNRLAKHVGWAIPAGADFSKIKADNGA